MSKVHFRVSKSVLNNYRNVIEYQVLKAKLITGKDDENWETNEAGMNDFHYLSQKKIISLQRPIILLPSTTVYRKRIGVMNINFVMPRFFF